MSERTASVAADRTVPRAMPGRRGLATRQRLLDSLEELLATSSYRDLKVTDVTRLAGTSPATFYQYFPDVEAAVLAIADEVADQGVQLHDLVAGRSWRGGAGYETAARLVDGMLEMWARHDAVLRVVELRAAEGDERFYTTRLRFLNSITTALADAAQAAGGSTTPMAMGGALVSMLAHVAAHQQGFETWRIPVTELRSAMTRLVYWGVTGRRPPR